MKNCIKNMEILVAFLTKHQLTNYAKSLYNDAIIWEVQ